MKVLALLLFLFAMTAYGADITGGEIIEKPIGEAIAGKTISIVEGGARKAITISTDTPTTGIKSVLNYDIFTKGDFAQSQQIIEFLDANKANPDFEKTKLLMRAALNTSLKKHDEAIADANALETLDPEFHPAERICNEILSVHEKQGAKGVEVLAAKMMALTKEQRGLKIRQYSTNGEDYVNMHLFRVKSKDACSSPALALALIDQMKYEDCQTTMTRMKYQYHKAHMFLTLSYSGKLGAYKQQVLAEASAATDEFIKLAGHDSRHCSYKSELLFARKDYAGTIQCMMDYVNDSIQYQNENPTNLGSVKVFNQYGLRLGPRKYGQPYVNILMNAAKAYEGLLMPPQAKAIYQYLYTAEWLNDPSDRTKASFTRLPEAYVIDVRNNMRRLADVEPDQPTLDLLNSVIVDN